MTYRQIFEAAREAGHEWADAALENCYQFGTAEDEPQNQTLLNAVWGAFVWGKTAQGVKYWGRVEESLRGIR